MFTHKLKLKSTIFGRLDSYLKKQKRQKKAFHQSVIPINNVQNSEGRQLHFQDRCTFVSMKLPEKIQCLDYLNLLHISSRILLHVLKLSQLTSHVPSTNRNLPINNALTCKKEEKTKLPISYTYNRAAVRKTCVRKMLMSDK
jgi:hypothetical protein